MAADDTAGVLTAAQSFGLAFGITVALGDAPRKTIASFARSDRDFTDAEVTQVRGLIADLVEMTAAPGALTELDQDFLRKMSVAVTRG